MSSSLPTPISTVSGVCELLRRAPPPLPCWILYELDKVNLSNYSPENTGEGRLETQILSRIIERGRKLNPPGLALTAFPHSFFVLQLTVERIFQGNWRM